MIGHLAAGINEHPNPFHKWNDGSLFLARFDLFFQARPVDVDHRGKGLTFMSVNLKDGANVRMIECGGRLGFLQECLLCVALALP